MILHLLLAIQTSGLQNPNFDYSGLPTFDAPESAMAIRSHSVTVEVGDTFADVVTVTQIRNLTGATLAVRMHVPRYRQGDVGAAKPDFPIAMTINGLPLKVQPSTAMPPIIRSAKTVLLRSEQDATIFLAKNATYGLRLSYRVPIGRAGFDHKMKVTGYVLNEGRAIDQLAISYRTASGVVFRLPRPSPDLGWQVGAKGAFVKKANFTPTGELTYVTYYPGGFDEIGD